MKKKRVLYAGIKYAYAKPSQGFSYEHYNLLDSLRQMKQVEVREFDWVSLYHRQGRERMNRQLLRQVDQFKPDLVFFTLFREEFEKKTIEAVSRQTLTFNWFNDDLARFSNYVQHWAPLFSWVGTITPSLMPRYRQIDCQKVIQVKFAANPRLYQNLALKKKYDLGFVGMAHSNRRRIIHQLVKSGLSIRAWGPGWPNGPVGFPKMIKIFNQTKINLNLTTFSFSYPWGRFLPWFLQPLSVRGRGVSKGINARVFEVPCCGSFLLTEVSPDLEKFYQIGKEIVVFEDFKDLVKKIKYYLQHEKEREAIAQRGHQRTLKEHTYVKRFEEIFEKIFQA